MRGFTYMSNASYKIKESYKIDVVVTLAGDFSKGIKKI